MFKSLFDDPLQSITSSWALFLHKYGDVGKSVRDEFYMSMYPFAGFVLVIFSIISCLIYYYHMNRLFGDNYSKRTYFTTLIVNSLAIGIVTFTKARLLLKSFTCPTSPHIVGLALINFAFGAFLFFLISCFIKWNSPMGKRTPF